MRFDRTYCQYLTLHIWTVNTLTKGWIKERDPVRSPRKAFHVRWCSNGKDWESVAAIAQSWSVYGPETAGPRLQKVHLTQMARPGEGVYTSVVYLSLLPLTPVFSDQPDCTVYTEDATEWRRVYNLWKRSVKFWSPYEGRHCPRAHSAFDGLLVEGRCR